MTYQAILGDLQRRKFSPIYVFSGDEPYYIDALSDYIIKNVLEPDEKEFNQSVLYGQDVSPDEVAAMARRFPMMAPYQVIVVREAQIWKSLEGLMPIAQNPVATTILAICLKGKKLDKRQKVYKSLAASAVIFESVKMKDSELKGWIGRYCAEHQLPIAPQAIELLGESLGTDTGKLINALEKLKIVCGGKDQITTAMVSEHIGINKDFNIFELRKALSYKQERKALMIANYFASNQKEHNIIPTIYGLFGFFNQIVKYHYVADKNNNSAVAREVGVSPYFIGDIRKAAANYPKIKLMKAFEVLHDMDLKSKGVGAANADTGELTREMVARLLRL